MDDAEEVMISGQSLYYTDPQPSRADIDQLPGGVVLEFGARW
jgi:hypothetical protein